ncbi:MAG: UDP-N-acetylglucosamine 2-epimerase (non-hydrolyzing), partial [Spirochaetes bacterium]|nr:UDP-N-acetylglucosamine 2-epimerase (non-hydrolyzing) [Spirochaetota bacterium]
GARPQFIKAAAVSRAIQQFNHGNQYNSITEKILHTGQHFDHNMSQVFFEQMQIPRPDYHLNVHSLSHSSMISQMMTGIEEILCKEQPDWILVYGDTNTTLAGALTAAQMQIPVAHIEAGLRSYNMEMPEEKNRILTDRISSILFCPTATAVNNLTKEGMSIPWKSSSNIIFPMIKQVGDVMYDCALFYQKYMQKPDFHIPSDFVLATVHRAENTDNSERLQQIILAFNEISQEKPVIVPLHPRTQKFINQLNIPIKFQILEPVGYLEMIFLLTNCNLVMTDSGGLQKEAYFFKKACIILREETEWIELVRYSNHKLVKSDADIILKNFHSIQKNPPQIKEQLYGNGQAASKIVQTLIEIEKS